MKLWNGPVNTSRCTIYFAVDGTYSKRLNYFCHYILSTSSAHPDKPYHRFKNSLNFHHLWENIPTCSYDYFLHNIFSSIIILFKVLFQENENEFQENETEFQENEIEFQENEIEF